MLSVAKKEKEKKPPVPLTWMVANILVTYRDQLSPKMRKAYNAGDDETMVEMLWEIQPYFAAWSNMIDKELKARGL